MPKCVECGVSVPNTGNPVVVLIEDSELGFFCSHICHNKRTKRILNEFTKSKLRNLR
jgi:hypothetical protein